MRPPMSHTDHCEARSGGSAGQHTPSSRPHPGAARAFAVTKPTCHDCQGFFVKHAQHTGSPQIVKDPETLRVFLPDGSVPESPLPSATVHVPAIDAKAAAAAHGAARVPEWAEGNL